MTLATLKKKNEVVEIITETFQNNPSVTAVIGPGGNAKKKIKRLAEYAFVKSLNRNGVYLSKNGLGTAFCYRSDHKSYDPREFLYELRFAFSVPPKNVIEALKRASYIKKHRFQDTHYYFWFFGVKKGGGKAGFELKSLLFELSDKDQVPIVLETSVERNKRIYERYGFNVYHEWDLPNSHYKLWFMIRRPNETNL